MKICKLLLVALALTATGCEGPGLSTRLYGPTVYVGPAFYPPPPRHYHMYYYPDWRCGCRYYHYY